MLKCGKGFGTMIDGDPELIVTEFSVLVHYLDQVLREHFKEETRNILMGAFFGGFNLEEIQKEKELEEKIN